MDGVELVFVSFRSFYFFLFFFLMMVTYVDAKLLKLCISQGILYFVFILLCRDEI